MACQHAVRVCVYFAVVIYRCMYVCVCVQCHSDCSRCKAPTCCFCCCHGNLAVTLATLRIRHVSHSRQTSQFFNPSVIYRVWPWPIPLPHVFPSLAWHDICICLVLFPHLQSTQTTNKSTYIFACILVSLSLSLTLVSLAVSLSCVFCSDLCSVLGLPYCLLALSPSTDWVQFFSACRLGVSSKVDYPGQLWRWRWRRNGNGNGKIHLRVKIQFRFPFCK